MEIKIAHNAGFCFGVRRAVNIAFNLGIRHPNQVFTIGPIIHNPQVVKELEKNSVHMVNSVDEIESGIMIVRSHGLPPSIIMEAEEKGLKVIDATCPFVKKVQILAMSLKKEGYPVLLVGDIEHPEVVAIRGYSNNKIMICQSKEDLERIKIPDRLGLVAQTTQDHSKFQEIVLALLSKVKELKLYNTICDSTIVRQETTLRLAKEVDLMLIIGGKNSANTNRLASISLSVNPKSYLIETKEEINQDWLQKVSKIGITAGASTPDWIINEVVDKIH